MDKKDLEELLANAQERLIALDLTIEAMEDEHSNEGFSSNHYRKIHEAREKLEKEIEGYKREINNYTPSTFD